MKTLVTVAFIIIFISSAVAVAPPANHRIGPVVGPVRHRPGIVFDDHDNKVIERFVTSFFFQKK